MREVTRVCAHCEQPFPWAVAGRGRAPMTCSEACRALRAAALKVAASASWPTCEECDDIVRSAGARWCERHYGRQRRTGDVATTKIRTPNGTCHHCGDPAARQRMFCSESCRRRDRIGAPGKADTCITCLGSVPADRFSRTMYCTTECMRIAERGRRYGITANEMYRMLIEASGCSLCGRDVELFVDHDHATGAVRALLCHECNAGIGLFFDNPALLRAAADYVERHAVEHKRPQIAPAC